MSEKSLFCGNNRPADPSKTADYRKGVICPATYVAPGQRAFLTSLP